MIRRKDIVTGTLKLCKNYDKYMQYGDKRYLGDCQIGHIEFSSIDYYTKIINEKAILIRVPDQRFIIVDSLDTYIEERLVDYGINIKTIGTTPYGDNTLFIEKETIEAYFDSNLDEVIKIKRLKMEIMSNE